ncbi:sigma factor-like helix-turn-helix DNA-binding protein [Streptomyces sp. NPDC093795]|uniref:sigma factor-like helix-turn-helix DNA-binding protein n=1 Tax=Streptomyces sp. NPDC093795 TaxID=3366051 RepID=UPI00381D1D8B
MDDKAVPTPTAPEARLRAVAYRLLGTYPEADEAVEEARGTRRWPEDPTMAVAAACLTRLRARETHHDEPPGRGQAPEGPPSAALDELTPPERLAFVLHDEFQIPYEEIAPILEHAPVAARRLAGRARHRLRDAEEMPEAV